MPCYFLKTKIMSKYKQFFTNHALLKERCVEICRLFHKNDPDLYPDILEEDLLFVFDERNTITVINSELITIEDYCYIDIQWLDATNDEIVKKIIENKVKREDYITFRSNKK
jgi:hypothetical protein